MTATRRTPDILRRLLRGILSLAGAGLLLVAVVACSGIPRSGPVEAGDAVGTDDDIDVIFLAADPTAGATQEQILSGFILAAKSPQDDYAIARRYLTDEAAALWKPNVETTVDSGNRSTSEVNDSTLELTIAPVAQVDQNGSYTPTLSSAPARLQFSFRQVDGEWRISGLDDGIVIEDVFFEQVFSSHALYFYDPTFTYLVPDLRWFPSSTSVGTRVVKALLAGPTAWLGEGAVVTAFPDGTNTTAVVTSGGQTQVELSSNVLQADVNDLQRMQYQLSESLRDLASASNVTITVDQNTVAIPGSTVKRPDAAPRVDARPLVLRDGVFGYLGGDSVSPIDGISDAVESLSPLSAAYSETSGTAAVKGATGAVFAVRAGAGGANASSTAPAPLDQRAGLIAPAVDPFGYVWSVPADDPAALVAYGPDSQAIDIATACVGASGVTSFEVSRDGTRAVASLSLDGVPKLVVAAVIRNADGVPERLGQAVELVSAPGVPVGATWVDQFSVAAANALPSGEVRATAQRLGGRMTALGSPADAVGLAGGNDIDGLRALTATGDILQQQGSAWQVTATGVTRLAVQN